MDNTLIDSFFTADFDSPTSDIDQMWRSPSHSPARSFEDSITGSPASFDELSDTPENDFSWAHSLQDFPGTMVGTESWLSQSLSSAGQLPQEAAFVPHVTSVPPPVSVVIPQSTKKSGRQDKSEPKNPRAPKRRKTDSLKEESLTIPENLKQAFAAAERGQIILSKEELLNLSSSLHEELLARVRNHRDLSTVEKQSVKRQRRLIKNRESAQASRQRKKTYVEELEKQVADLTNEKNQLIHNTSALSTENMFLKSQVESLKAALGAKNGNGVAPVLSRPVPSFKNTNFGTIPPISTTSGILFMILLFSFGIIFGNMQILNQGLARESAEILPGRIFVRDEFQPLSNGEGFKALVEDQNIPFVTRLHEKLAHGSLPSEASPVTNFGSMDVDIDSHSKVSQREEEEEQAMVATDMIWNPNATYLSCATVQQITPPKDGPWSAYQESTLVFLIPPSSLGVDQESTTLEVTCQVTNMKAINQNSLTGFANDASKTNSAF